MAINISVIALVAILKGNISSGVDATLRLNIYCFVLFTVTLVKLVELVRKISPKLVHSQFNSTLSSF